jgi:hypothetical protein
MNKTLQQLSFQFKITLENVKPRVWRRIVVPQAYTFFELYSAIDDAMGWGGGHLHNFYVAQSGTARPIVIELPKPDNFMHWDRDNRDERTELIADYFGKRIKQCRYNYDFGDNWEHTVLFERELPADPTTKYPICTAGKNACPPDDCGGPWGYEDLKRVLAGRQSAQRTELVEWLGLDHPGDFDPTEFDPTAVEFTSPAERLVEWNEMLQG